MTAVVSAVLRAAVDDLERRLPAGEGHAEAGDALRHLRPLHRPRPRHARRPLRQQRLHVERVSRVGKRERDVVGGTPPN